MKRVLIFLSLINYNNNSTLLLREKEQYGKMAQGGEKYVYLDINYLRNIIYSMLRTASHQPITRIITDYVFFSFFLGNDFLPCIPTLFIREGGIELLMQCYTQILTELDEYLMLGNDKSIGTKKVYAGKDNEGNYYILDAETGKILAKDNPNKSVADDNLPMAAE